jgi:hypothetical protein
VIAALVAAGAPSFMAPRRARGREAAPGSWAPAAAPLARLLALAAAAAALCAPAAAAVTTPFAAAGPALGLSTPEWSLFAPLGAPWRPGLFINGNRSYTFPAPPLKVKSDRGRPRRQGGSPCAQAAGRGPSSGCQAC